MRAQSSTDDVDDWISMIFLCLLRFLSHNHMIIMICYISYAAYIMVEIRKLWRKFQDTNLNIQRTRKHKRKWSSLFSIILGLINGSSGISTNGSPKIEISHATKFQNGKTSIVGCDLKIHFHREWWESWIWKRPSAFLYCAMHHRKVTWILINTIEFSRFQFWRLTNDLY